MNIDKMFALAGLMQNVQGKIQDSEILYENDEPIVQFSLRSDFRRDMMYRYKLTKILWDSVENVYLTWVATQLLREGYVCTPVTGGEVVSNPSGEVYQISDNICSCNSRNYPCKHLMLRNWELAYRVRKNNLRSRVEG
ncbi:MAG: hypothetical protein ACK518_03980 [bacterium]|jgi:hypothetical protein